MVGGTLLVRVDAGPRIGVGHLMRSLAIAQAWREVGGMATFAMHQAPSRAVERLRAERFEVLDVAPDAEAVVSACRQLTAAVVLLDGYHFDASFQRALKREGARCAVVDDNGEIGAYAADVVVNPNLFARMEFYHDHAPETRFLLGPEFALIREEFFPAQRDREPRRLASRVLFTFGGADPAQLSELSLDMLRARPQRFDSLLVVGGANPRRMPLTETAAGLRGVQVLYDPPNLPELMADADIAVTAAGGTCLELAFMGVPAMVVITAENQRAVAQSASQLGLVRNLGPAPSLTAATLGTELDSLMMDVDARRQMGRRGRALIDGRGASRVVAALQELRS